jgi:hypothetical protein
MREYLKLNILIVNLLSNYAPKDRDYDYKTIDSVFYH